MDRDVAVRRGRLTAPENVGEQHFLLLLYVVFELVAAGEEASDGQFDRHN